MERKKIRITIGPTGAARVDAEGMKGENCKDATKIIEKALSEGKGQTTVEYKEEWYQQEDHAGNISEHTKQTW